MKIYHSFHSTYEILVEQTPDHRFMVVMTSYGPHSNNLVLHAYHQKEAAISAARKFPEMYQIAEIKGYILNDKYFVNSVGKSIHISFAMDLDVTPEKFRSILK